ncbi:MAG: NRDE family protein [Melioribacteraceae bacterium]|nr:NRDE family protein [Melioribacteraceae bacterium]MCF8411843.1 NRDE family protein [Melioribacteraceae bacterium]MCF8431802.1 NRDE family protein [Melioribacteraceae bacterium]
MCLVAFAYKSHPKYKLIMVANRDEFLDRPTAAANWWEEHPEILSGKDLKAGGSWMGINKYGKIAVLTNYRLPELNINSSNSRGEIVINFLKESLEAKIYSQQLVAEKFAGYNLIFGNVDELFYINNRKSSLQKIDNGIHLLSNAELDTPWFKTERIKGRFTEIIKSDKINSGDLFEMMKDTKKANFGELPNTGIGRIKEKLISSAFIKSPTYGTRSTTILKIGNSGQVTFIERSFDRLFKGRVTRKIDFDLDKKKPAN